MTLPHDNDLEEGLLGACIIEPDILPHVRGLVTQDADFFNYFTRSAWKALCKLDDAHSAIDIVTVLKEMEKTGERVTFGEVTKLAERACASMAAETYARDLHALGVRRRVIEAHTSGVQRAYDLATPVEEVVAGSIGDVQTAANGLIGGRAQDATRIAADYTAAVYANVGKEAPGIATGFFDLDILLGGGFQPDNFAIVAARPGTGKTGLLDTIAMHTSKTHWTGLFSLEMSNAEQMGRMLAQETEIDSMRLRSGRLKEDEWPRLDEANARIQELKLWIDDTAPLSFVTLRAKAVQKRAQGKLDLCLVDYAGLMQGVGNSPYERATYLSNNLKALARELHVPVLAAQQLNRKVEARENNEPTLFDLRDSGSWEQDSDIVLLLWNEGEDIPNTELVPLKLRLAKHRNGPTGVVNVMRVTRTTKFVSAERMTRND